MLGSTMLDEWGHVFNPNTELPDFKISVPSHSYLDPKPSSSYYVTIATTSSVNESDQQLLDHISSALERYTEQ